MSFFKRSKKQPKGAAGAAGIFEDEAAFLKAASRLREKTGSFEAISPYPVHGLEEALRLKRSWIPWVCFAGGLFGFSFGLWLTWWTSAVSWPVIVGGKPFWSLPAFVPVIFELTILFSALAAIGGLLYACSLPAVRPPIIDPALTSHKFALFIPFKEGMSNAAALALLKELSPSQILEARF